MRRLLSFRSSLRRGRTPVAMLAPAAFSASLPSARSWGWGVASVSPQPVFLEVNDDNHSWCANRDQS